MKKTIIAALCAFACLTAGCAKKPAEAAKPLTGIDPCFSEPLGHYNESPSVLRTGNVQYMFYTRNAVSGDSTSDTVAVRRAEYRDGQWHYGEGKTVLSVSTDGWDSGSVFSADVVKGEFLYAGEQYGYLMAYSGAKKGRSNAQIGLAVAQTPDGEYIRVGDSPVIAFDKTDQTPVGLTNYKGAVEPSLVSYDRKSRVTLFYSFYGKFNASYAVEMDCSDLNVIVRGGRMKVNTAGLADGNENTALFAGDYAFDPDENIYVVCRNYAGSVSGLPAVSEAVQVVTAPAAELFRPVDGLPGGTPRAIWTLYSDKQRRISAIHTAIDGDDTARSGGYKRVYNGAIATDEYGHTVSSRRADVYFTSSAVSGDEGLTGDQYLYTPMIHEFILTRGTV